MGVESWLRLALAPEVGPVLGHRLLGALGSPEAVFAATERQLLSVSGLGASRVARLMDSTVQRVAHEEAERVRAAGVRLVTLADEEYPPLLRRLDYPPLLLWVRGRIEPVDRLAVAMVGPRTPSSYARLMTGALAPQLAAHGLTIVSGLAHGIDAEAHRAAIENGGRTLAVLGQGLGTAVYPQANAALAERIVAENLGALISIFSMTTEPGPGLFPLRNEIIAGLALGTLVVEAATTSGTLITARHAVAASRVVMACPGDANRRSAQGSNRLIADGAFLVQTAEDVLAALGQDLRHEKEALGLDCGAQPGIELSGKASSASDGAGIKHEDGAGGPESHPVFTRAGADALARMLMAMLGEEPLPADLIIERCAEQGHTHSAVLERLLRLEMDGLLRQMPGRLYALSTLPR